MTKQIIHKRHMYNDRYKDKGSSYKAGTKRNIDKQKSLKEFVNKPYKSIKCSYNICKNEAIGYYSTRSSGLWLCKNHASGELRTLVSDIKKDPNHPQRWQLTDKFTNEKYIEPERVYNYTGRKEVKDYIDSKIRDKIYPYSVSSVEGNMYLSGLYKEIEIIKRYKTCA